MFHLGPDDPTTLDAMFNFARSSQHIGELDESYHLLEVVLKKRRHFFCPDLPETLMAMNELGINLTAQGVRLDEGENLITTALSIRREVLGEEHPYTLRIHACYGYAFVLLHKKDYHEAERYCLLIMEKFKETNVIAPGSARVLATVDILFEVYRKQDRTEELDQLKKDYLNLTKAVTERYGLTLGDQGPQARAHDPCIYTS
ncbi:hypothetical protein CIB48_g4775 [Xylaria polymorpha]|nr:hypothetical protein CIB48_g4775 [Xylaria polymorpha]